MSRKDRKMIYKTPEEIERSRVACQLVCKTLTEVGKMLRPGLTGLEIDTFAEEFIRDHGAVPGFKGLYGCPSTLLVSQNEEVVHGLPDQNQVFKDGDILSIDCGTIVNEFYGDAAYTFCVGDVVEEVMDLCRRTKHSLYLGIDAARAGKRVGDISHAIQYYTEREHGYGVVRELVGHGLGRSLHEAPDVPNFGKRGRGPVLKAGLIIAIEPMITLGRKDVHGRDDGWTIVTRDGKPAAHYEHSIAISPGGAPADLMSDHRPIEEAIRNNPNLKYVDNLDEELVAIYQPVAASI
ncbi:type I methionyl aminopeptidase [Lewinella sp. 4G2]|uniref:type I methionyl aminopeptidase n=1 Tax=Lewinella sp. 4G2 TaxID=1803372 RepID=UPI0007B4889F|nr:type I methionyl aminopeptidase [Lewinella sp. 4G2]OAV46185.1 type I methionyl aminopeptidase [Lewinella sp. 4G2]